MTKNELFYNNRYLVLYLLKKIDYPYYLYDDLIQAGYLGLWQAIKNYDESKKIHLSSFATKYIMGSFFKEINNYKIKEKEIKVDLKDLSNLTYSNFENKIWMLNKEERTIVKLKFILNYDFKTIGNFLSKSESTIKKKYHNLIIKLKNENF